MHAEAAYRNDIDGLRAIAVSIIVLFHMGVTALGGGYVGVDVFFVISGYLITGQILRDLQRGGFSFGTFYMRRLRRLAPSLLVVLFATLLAGFFLLGPDHYERLGRSTVAALFSVSNIFFWTEAGYFDEAAINKPLLHLWSLAVEEQFYLVWPVLLVILARLGRLTAVPAVLFGLGAISLVASELLLDDDPSAVFFLTPFRLAEFALGAALAARTKPVFQTAKAGNVASVAGLGLIVLSALVLNDDTRFPGIHSMFPCLGSALLIASGPAGVVNRTLLSLGAMRYVGKTSYSVYLAHWPLLVFYAYYHNAPDTLVEVAGLSLAALAAGAFLYHVVETPFRRRGAAGFRISGPWLRRAVLAVFLPTLVIGIHVAQNKGYRWRLTEDIQKINRMLEIAEDEREIAIRRPRCHFGGNEIAIYLESFEDCLPKDRSHMVVVMGDSHAADIYTGLVRLSPGTRFVQLTGAGCSVGRRESFQNRCVPLMEKSMAWIRENAGNIDAILYTHRAARLFRGDAGDWVGMGLNPDVPDRVRRFFDTLTSIGPQVIYLAPRPEIFPKIQVMVARSMTVDQLHEQLRGFDRHLFAELDRSLSAAMQGSKARYISSHDAMCAGNDCMVLDDRGLPIFVDSSHLSPYGAAYFLRHLFERHPDLPALLNLSLEDQAAL
ncbi:acyltransferase family protein [Actibacterium ureilyticum]|uniref:acyltransferase family protein n=1 Tax=Actibacterium ureilyticum TaxID=1590614 RepID=UPI000BAB0C53|nr:acyltransferase family protein [Actibacterium ureilyticum]